MISTNASLVGFGGSQVFPLGTVTLSIMVGDYPQQITKDVTFLVVDCSSAYNTILGQPTLNSWNAVTSTYHLMIKFPTDYGIKKLRGSQMAARMLLSHDRDEGSGSSLEYRRAPDGDRANREARRNTP